MARLAQARIAAADKLVKDLSLFYDRGAATFSDLAAANRMAYEARLEGGVHGADLVAAATTYRDAMKAAADRTSQRYKSGAASEADVDMAQYQLAEAEFRLAQATAMTSP
jgi:outer membrane protein TolC